MPNQGRDDGQPAQAAGDVHVVAFGQVQGETFVVAGGGARVVATITGDPTEVGEGAPHPVGVGEVPVPPQRLLEEFPGAVEVAVLAIGDQPQFVQRVRREQRGVLREIERQPLLQERPSQVEVPLVLRHQPRNVEADGDLRQVPELPEQDDRGRNEIGGPWQIALRPSQVRRPREYPGTGPGGGASVAGQRSLRPDASFAEVATKVPEAAECECQALDDLGLAGLQGPSHHRPQIVVLGVETTQPGAVVRPKDAVVASLGQ